MRVVRCTLVGLLAVGALSAQLPLLLEQHCAECHTGDDADRGFEIDKLFAADAAADERFEERLLLAVRRLRSRTMPPPAEGALPSDEDRRAIVGELAKLAPRTPGARVARMRRLTRRQYERTVADVFGVKWGEDDLLPDDATAHGFEGIGDVQFLTPLLFEKYLDAATVVADAVLASDDASAAIFASDAAIDASLRRLLPRAWRRPVADDEVVALAADFAAHRERGADVRDARHALLRAIVASPNFLFRAEQGDENAPTELTAHELAVRLSYLLTAGPPDELLRARADDGTLRDADVLRAEARRLVQRDHGRTFAEDFAAQWLSLRDVLTATADFRRFPEIWNHSLRPSMHEEAVRLVAHVVGEDRSVLELLDSDYTFVNGALAKHYGFDGADEREWRRVELSDRRRGGLLGTGAVLMGTSYPLRTSPVKRGQWILSKLLDAPPPPAPADAGVLPRDDKNDKGLSLRQQLERHRRQKSCASCHAEMDALGFALEPFDPLGRWRDEVHGVAVDAVAALPDGMVIDGPVALKDALLRRSDDFVRAFAKNLLVYAVGRDMLLADEPELAAIVERTRAGGHRFSALLDAVVTSPLFVLRDPDQRP